MRTRLLEAQVRRLERERGLKARRVHNVVWRSGKPNRVPAELDPRGVYCHYFLNGRPSDADWERHWLSIPVKGGKSSRRRSHA